jgi:hypothetical protein
VNRARWVPGAKGISFVFIKYCGKGKTFRPLAAIFLGIEYFQSKKKDLV